MCVKIEGAWNDCLLLIFSSTLPPQPCLHNFCQSKGKSLPSWCSQSWCIGYLSLCNKIAQSLEAWNSQHLLLHTVCQHQKSGSVLARWSSFRVLRWHLSCWLELESLKTWPGPLDPLRDILQNNWHVFLTNVKVKKDQGWKILSD